MAKKTNNKSEKFFRGKKYSGKRSGRYNKADDKEADFKSNSKTHNDVSWYTPDAQILNDVARIPYSIPTGMPISRPYSSQGSNGSDLAIPGILVQDVMPTLGYANSPSDPVNIAAQGVYSFVRHLNSGSRNYDPVDLMLYIGALDSVYSTISWATRLYATICSYSQGNRYTPRLIIEAQNVDFDNLADNMVQFRTQLNQRIAKASQLMVPNIMPIFERHRWLFANYYIEGDSMKDQIYFYNPTGYYRFKLDSDDAGMLECVSFASIRSKLLYTDIIAMLDDMLDPIIQDEDFNIMSGDIYKAYQGNIVTYSMVPDLIAMNYTFDENVLLQFKNSKSKGVTLDSNNRYANGFFNITQDSTKSYLVVNNNAGALCNFNDVFQGLLPVTTASSALAKSAARITNQFWTKPILLTTPHFSPDVSENMVMTRGTLSAEVSFGATAVDDVMKVYYGSEWYLGFRIFTRARSRSTRTVTTASHSWNLVNAFNANYSIWTASEYNTYMTELLNAISNLTKFKYHPEAFVVFGALMAGGSTADFHDANESFFEVDNYSLVDYNVIRAMHDAALLGEYNVPRIALLPS